MFVYQPVFVGIGLHDLLPHAVEHDPPVFRPPHSAVTSRINEARSTQRVVKSNIFIDCMLW